MAEHTLDGHMGVAVTIDMCLACQAFWFDGRESLQLTPGSTLKLFRLIGELTSSARQPMSASCTCPRCGLRLVPVQDFQRTTRFQYRRCSRRHGRLITFFDFLREKDFIRPLSAAQIAELRSNVDSINCSNCGAPVDLATTSTCAHCSSPLSMLDMSRAGEVIAELQQADRARAGVDPAIGLNLERARHEVERAFASFDRGPTWFSDVSASGHVGAGLKALSRWLKREG